MGLALGIKFGPPIGRLHSQNPKLRIGCLQKTVHRSITEGAEALLPVQCRNRRSTLSPEIVLYIDNDAWYLRCCAVVAMVLDIGLLSWCYLPHANGRLSLTLAQ